MPSESTIIKAFLRVLKVTQVHKFKSLKKVETRGHQLKLDITAKSHLYEVMVVEVSHS